jgi:hypothetical protein
MKKGGDCGNLFEGLYDEFSEMGIVIMKVIQ